MKKYYVSLETAKVLKEKGYNEPCSYWYSRHGLLSSNLIAKKKNNTCNKVVLCIVPELHEVQQWLREEHKAEIVIGIDVDFTWRDDDEDLTGESIANIMYYTYDICIYNRWLMTNTISCADNKYTTYEEALEAGINEALKMI